MNRISTVRLLFSVLDVFGYVFVMFISPIKKIRKIGSDLPRKEGFTLFKKKGLSSDGHNCPYVISVAFIVRNFMNGLRITRVLFIGMLFIILFCFPTVFIDVYVNMGSYL